MNRRFNADTTSELRRRRKAFLDRINRIDRILGWEGLREWPLVLGIFVGRRRGEGVGLAGKREPLRPFQGRWFRGGVPVVSSRCSSTTG